MIPWSTCMLQAIDEFLKFTNQVFRENTEWGYMCLQVRYMKYLEDHNSFDDDNTIM